MPPLLQSKLGKRYVGSQYVVTLQHMRNRGLPSWLSPCQTFGWSGAVDGIAVYQVNWKKSKRPIRCRGLRDKNLHLLHLWIAKRDLKLAQTLANGNCTPSAVPEEPDAVFQVRSVDTSKKNVLRVVGEEKREEEGDGPRFSMATFRSRGQQNDFAAFCDRFCPIFYKSEVNFTAC